MTIASDFASNIEPSFSSGIPERPPSKARIWFDLILSLVLVGLLAGVITLLTLPVAERNFVNKNPKVIQALFDDSVERGVWLKANLKKAAELIAPLQSLPVDVVELSLKRYEFNVKPVPASVIADQQKLADTFFELKLIPKAIVVSDAAYKPAP